MTFEEILAQAVAMLQCRGRIAYSALKRQFDLDADYLEDLKDAILFEHPVVDEEGKGLVWKGEEETPESTSTMTPPTELEVPQETQLIQTEPPPTELPTPDAERRQLTVMFCDLADMNRKFKRYFRPAAPAVRPRRVVRYPRATPAASPARRSGLRKRCAARRGTVMRGLDRPLRMGQQGVAGVCWDGGLATAGFTLGGGDFKTALHGPKGQKTPQRRALRL